MCRAPEPLCEGQRAGALTAPLHGPETPPLTGPSLGPDETFWLSWEGYQVLRGEKIAPQS